MTRLRPDGLQPFLFRILTPYQETEQISLMHILAQ